MARISQYCKSKKIKGGRTATFYPDLKEWKKICGLSAYDTQVCKYFQISQETFYAFIDREKYKEEQDSSYSSEFLESHKAERNKTRDFISAKFLENIRNGDTSSTIFGMKTFNNMIEAKDLKHIELKKYEIAFKTKQFLTELANKFELNIEELNAFAGKYFKDAKLDEI